jgi:hypothetical protein
MFFVSCSGNDEKKGKILPEEKMEAVLWDVIEADVYTFTQARMDSSFIPSRENALLQQTIFRKHDVSREEYYNSLEYYLQHSEKFIPMLDSLMAKHPAISPVKKRDLRNIDSLKLLVQ